LAFVIFLPVIGFVLTAKAIGTKLATYKNIIVEVVSNVATPPATPIEATLIEKREPITSADGIEEEKELAAEISKRRDAGEK
jgi:hypothetical protein